MKQEPVNAPPPLTKRRLDYLQGEKEKLGPGELRRVRRGYIKSNLMKFFRRSLTILTLGVRLSSQIQDKKVLKIIRCDLKNLCKVILKSEDANTQRAFFSQSEFLYHQ